MHGVVEFLLVLVLRFEVGVPATTYIEGDSYPTLDLRRAEGDRSVEWLTQDFVAVKYYCVRKEAP